MTARSLLRSSAVLALCLALALPACPQVGGNLNIGPSKGEIIGIFVGMAAAFAGVGLLIYHERHKHASITGCVAAGGDGLTLQNEKDKKVYALADYSAVVKAGERVTVQGKRSKGSDGKTAFEVEKLTKDFGTCTP